MTDPGAQKFNRLKAARGLAWLISAWALIRRQPIRLLLMSLFLQFLLSLSQAGAIGVLVILCLPALSAGMLQALFMVDQGQKPALPVLFMPFTAAKTLSKLLLLGAIVMVLGFIIITLVMSGQVMNMDPELISRLEQGDLEALQLLDPKIMQNAVFAMLIGATVSGTITYFAVPLIWFQNRQVGTAIALCLKALAGNWRPLLMVGLMLGFLAVPIGLLFGFLYLSALSGDTASPVLAILVLLLGPLFQLLLFATQYLAFRDIFALKAEPSSSKEKADDQLIA